MEKMAYMVTFLTTENHDLRKANEALSKRRRARKTHVDERGALIAEEGRNILAQKEVAAQVRWELRKHRGGIGGS